MSFIVGIGGTVVGACGRGMKASSWSSLLNKGVKKVLDFKGPVGSVGVVATCLYEGG